MEFNDNKPIYRQILDYAFHCILTEVWREGEMIPSVRELTSELGVNNRTVLKAFDELQSLSVIESRRGLGFMLAKNAVDKLGNTSSAIPRRPLSVPIWNLVAKRQ